MIKKTSPSQIVLRMSMKPTPGRIVLYHFISGAQNVTRPAIVVKVNDDSTVNLRIFFDGPDGVDQWSDNWFPSVPESVESDEWKHDTWSWPPRG